MDNLNLNNSNMGWAMTSLALTDVVDRKVNDGEPAKLTEAQKEEALNRYKDGDRSDEVIRILDRSGL